MYQFDYVRAKTLKDAGRLLARHAEAKLVAGGMTLIPTLKQRLARPSHLVDVAQLPELQGIKAKAGRVEIGAAVRHQQVASSAVVRKAIPALAQLAGVIGDPPRANGSWRSTLISSPACGGGLRRGQSHTAHAHRHYAIFDNAHLVHYVEA